MLTWGSLIYNISFDCKFIDKPEVTVRHPIVNTGETYTAQIVCTVHAYPKVKVTWEKEQINEDESTAFMQLATDNPSGRYETFRPKEVVQSSENASMVSPGHSHGLKVKRIVAKDFGRYRCKAENKLGSAYSDFITLTGNNFFTSYPMYWNYPMKSVKYENNFVRFFVEVYFHALFYTYTYIHTRVHP